MAVYTHITEAELAAHLGQYEIGAPLSLAGISDGIDNTNYVFTTPQGRFILTIFEGRVRAEDLPFHLGFMDHLARKGIPAPAVIAPRGGGTVAPFRDQLSAVTVFLEGRNDLPPDPARCRAMGETLARMHLAAGDFPLRLPNALSLPRWRELVGTRADEVEAGLAAFLADELAALGRLMPEGLPSGAVHADAFPNNVFFDGDRLAGVIDFYFSCTDSFAYDLMLTVNGWCFDAQGAADAARVSAMMEGYAAVRGLSAEEKAALPVLGRAAAMRITATRLHDALHPRAGAVVGALDPLQHVRIISHWRGA